MHTAINKIQYRSDILVAFTNVITIIIVQSESDVVIS